MEAKRSRAEAAAETVSRLVAVAQTAFSWLSGKAIVLVKFDRAEIMAAVPDNGPVEMRVVGRLKDMYFFSGVDNVRIR